MAARPRDGPEDLPTADRGAAGDVLQGSVERVTYHDPSSLYLVLRIKPDTGYRLPSPPSPFDPTVAAVGRAPAPGAGLRVRLQGRWTEHRTHGPQFEFAALEVLGPADAEGLVKYLASGPFEGIGDTLARRIVGELGVDALERILAAPERLEKIRGLRPAVREKLVATIAREVGAHKVQAFLRGAGLGAWQASAVVRKLGPDCEARVRADPYVLTAVNGIGFATADRSASLLGLASDDPRRLRAAVLAAARAAAEDGHSFLPRSISIARAAELLAASAAGAGRAGPPAFLAAHRELASQGDLVLDDAPEAASSAEDPDVYLPWLHHSERSLARNLARLLGERVPALAAASEVAAAETRTGWTLDRSQREAVLGLLATPVGLLTGGPGVGKTTIVQLIVALAQGAGARVRLASPTGRAAKRLAEATGHEAQTIHRLLGYDPQRSAGGEAFAHDQHDPLEADVVVIDEASMLDVVLAHHLVRAIRPPTRLLLVGDPDQLPSVGPGNVLCDLIASDAVPVFRLTHIHRQAERSLIVANAHRILQGELPHLPERGDLGSDFYFFPAEDPESCADRVIDVVTRRIPERFGGSWIEDVQVIAPMYRGPCGVDALNERLRSELHAGGASALERGGAWSVGDRVIHTRNDYAKEVFNGDMGRILRVADEGVVVGFPEREVFYAPGDLSDLQPAFAITVHRAQGAEFPTIVFPLTTQHALMLQRNLLYTAITRARSLVVLVGSRKALGMAIDNAEPRERRSRLGARLRSERRA